MGVAWATGVTQFTCSKTLLLNAAGGGLKKREAAGRSREDSAEALEWPRKMMSDLRLGSTEI